MHRFVTRLAHFMALLGGLMLSALILLVCVSVTGRGLNSFAHNEAFAGRFPEWSQALIDSGVGAVQGDFELVEAGVAFAIFAFLPICQLRGAHATVDIFTASLPPRAVQFLRLFWEMLLAAAMLLIAFRLCFGMLDKLRYAETTFLLQFPVWWAYALSFAAASVAALVALYCAWTRLRLFLLGRPDPQNLERLEAPHGATS